ncbi:MAG: lipopolysaccharide heptosyltransferase II [Proteobacteria bacterium]|nr:lipopolysaccharide heptosyltransferase II [Pseudomonadota bacterium]
MSREGRRPSPFLLLAPHPMPRILIVAPSWIGDTLLAQPLLRRLHDRLGSASIDALAPPWCGPLLARMPEINEVIASPFAHGELKLRARWQLGRELARRKYDKAIVLPNSFKSALIPFFADIPLRAGYVGESRYGLLNLAHKLDQAKVPLMSERYAQLAEKPGAELQRPLPRVRLETDPVNTARTTARLALDRSRPVAAFCPGAEYGPAKRWPVRHFAALARELARRGYAVWLIGSDKDAPTGEEIRAQSGGACENLCGKTDLAAAIDLIACARIVVSNDSGLMHVAAALGRPLVALYGSSSPEHTPPLSLSSQPGSARIARIEIECSPCYARECPLAHFKCMNDLAPEQVLAEIDALLAAAGAG